MDTYHFPQLEHGSCMNNMGVEILHWHEFPQQRNSIPYVYLTHHTLRQSTGSQWWELLEHPMKGTEQLD